MTSSTARFQKMDNENQLLDSEGDVEMDTNMQGAQPQMGIRDRFYAIKRRNLIIGITVVCVVVIALFVISTVVGHYTAKKSHEKSKAPSTSALVMNWSRWADWGPCSVTCDKGLRRRSRKCASNSTHHCVGQNADVDICVMEDCNDDVWMDWSKWSKCTFESGTCKKSRSRACRNTALKIQGGRCVGNNVQETKCAPKFCQGASWAEWQNWSNCSVNCDFGVRTRQRFCKDHTGLKINESQCTGTNKEKDWCHIVDCRDLDECLSNPCVKGTCIDKLKGYECSCDLGWHGVTCEIQDSCASNPCVYGTCIDHDSGYNCSCKGAVGPTCATPVHDCVDVRDAGHRVTGVYSIRVDNGNTTKEVLCEMESQDGGWTVIQYRFNGSVNFYKDFQEYRYGFGDPHGEYWLGLQYIYQLTRQETMLRIELVGADHAKAYELFQYFSISEYPDYTLDVREPSGTTGSSSTGLMYNNNYKFSTFDRDESGNNCAVKDYGGWWYGNCAYANLNGYYGTPGDSSGYNGRGEAGMTYRSFKNYEMLRESKMMLRRKNA